MSDAVLLDAASLLLLLSYCWVSMQQPCLGEEQAWAVGLAAVTCQGSFLALLVCSCANCSPCCCLPGGSSGVCAVEAFPTLLWWLSQFSPHTGHTDFALKVLLMPPPVVLRAEQPLPLAAAPPVPLLCLSRGTWSVCASEGVLGPKPSLPCALPQWESFVGSLVVRSSPSLSSGVLCCSEAGPGWV